MSSLKASVSGIRGIVGDTLTPEVVVSYTSAFSAWLGGGCVAVGRDTRVSGPLYQRIVEGVLSASGIDVIDIGIVPTPTLLQYVRENKLAGGVLLTASHNPVAWNALKLVKSGGAFLEQPDFEAVTALLDKDKAYTPVSGIGTFESDRDAAVSQAGLLIDRYGCGDIRKRAFTVAVDPGNGAGAVMDRMFLEKLGCRVVSVNEEITGDFSRPPEPRPDALAGLSALVKESGAVVGFAQDPDADRLCLVDEKGTPLSEELTLALCLQAFYKRGGSGDVVVNMSTSRVNDDVAAAFGGKVHRSKVGEANVLGTMRDMDAPIGGEGNGGIIYPALNPCRDSFVGMMMVLDLLVIEDRPLSEIAADLPAYAMEKLKLPVKGENAALQEALEEAFRGIGEESFSVNSLDGLRFDFSDGWIHLRESNTEPVMRLIAESADRGKMTGWILAARSVTEG